MKSWDLIRAFLALHRAGTFEGAAHLLGVDHSTLRRRIQTLEQDMGAALFSRQDGCYQVTPAMRPLLESATRMEASSKCFFEGPGGGNSGVVRVTMLDVFAGWLSPDLGRFRQLYPDIQLDIGTEHHFVDLERDMVDVAIRLARPTRGNSRLRKLGDVRYGVYAAPSYLAQRASEGVGSVEKLLTLSVRFMHRDHDFLVGETAWMLERLPAGQVVSSTDSYLVLRQLCEAGMGLALMPELLGDASASLVRLDDTCPGSCDVWSVVHADTGSTTRVRLFVDFITQTFRRRLAGAASMAKVDTAAADETARSSMNCPV